MSVIESQRRGNIYFYVKLFLYFVFYINHDYWIVTGRRVHDAELELFLQAHAKNNSKFKNRYNISKSPNLGK